MSLHLAVVDAASIFRNGLRASVTALDSVRFIGAFESLAAFEAFPQRDTVEVLVLGDNASSESIEDQVEHLRTLLPQLRIIILAGQFNVLQIEQLTRLGVVGFIRRDEEIDNVIISALQITQQGGQFMSPAARATFSQESDPRPIPMLSARQRQVIYYMQQRMTAQQIATTMNTSIQSIYSIQRRLRSKLGVDHSYEIVLEAARRGILEDAS